MKKATLLLFALLLLLVSCEGLGESGVSTVGTTAATTAALPPVTTAALPPVTTAVTTVEPPVGAPSYGDIVGRPSAGQRATVYAFRADSTLLELTCPIEWQTEPLSDGGFTLLRDGEPVGYLVGTSAADTADRTVLETEARYVDSVDITRYIEEDGEAAFRYRYVYRYSSNGSVRTVTLVADYAELDEAGAEALFLGTATVDKYKSKTVGALSFYLDYVCNPPSVLILGNSFVNSSKIGNILREMVANGGKECTVEAISRGYARVGTYTSDEALMASIRAGKYAVVFICGFYGEAEIDNLGILKEACEESVTELAMLPAHNEGAAVIAAAQEAHPTVFCLNWKAELDMLLERGVDRWDLCINDSHLHSTPLAGYVGAHMIYRALYDELPIIPMQTAIKQDYIDGILGEYAYVGDAKVYDKNAISYFD